MQNFSWPYRFSEFVSATDGVFTLISTSGQHRTVPVQKDGTFRIDSVQPGTYTVSVQSTTYGVGKLREPKLDVPLGGCAIANGWFETGSTLSGRVFDADGKPAAHVRLELGEVQSGNKLRVIPQTWSNTDQDGKFNISNVPRGKVVLAANLKGAPTAEMPFDPVYAPGTQDLSSARVFVVPPGEHVNDLSLKLPRPLTVGELYVDVTWPDGSPARGGARAFADWNGARADFERAPNETNRVKLRLAVQRKYEIRVDWIDAKPGKFLFVEGAATKTVEFTRDGQSLELRLKEFRQQ